MTRMWRVPPSRAHRRTATVLAFLAVLLLLPGWSAGSAPVSAPAQCREVTVPVKVGGYSGPISGTLCAPKCATSVQLLVHGFTYDRNYWDFPYRPEKYSYVRRANAEGYATLAIDRLGEGRSGRPLSPFVTYDSNATAIHQVVRALRDGKFGTSYRKVTLVGHSYGSVASYQVAGRYRDVDALVITGGAHIVSAPNVTTLIVANSYPSMLDPKFRGQGRDPGYFTTLPGKRKVFFNEDNVEPGVLRTDERLKQSYALTELPTALPYTFRTESKRINIPTFTINGTEDPFFCKGIEVADCRSERALADFERPFYGPRAIVETALVPGAGHDLNLERSAGSTFGRILDFVNRHVGA